MGMKSYGFASLLIIVLLNGCSPAKKIAHENTVLQGVLQQHVVYLADDRLEGRRTGTAGERLAMEYISEQFRQSGLSPRGTDGFYQSFSVQEGKKLAPDCFLTIANKKLQPGKDFFVFPFSANAAVGGTVMPGVLEVGAPWFIDLKEVIEDNKSNPHFDIAAHVYEFGTKALVKGATALFWYNSGAVDDKLAFNPKEKLPPLGLPVFYINKAVLSSFTNQESSTLEFSARASLIDSVRTGTNVIGFIDNKAATTVVLGAHFDHLGYGEDGNSRNDKKEPAIHNGADDNASGTATLIGLAGRLKKSATPTHNYLFIAFSGEELGLYGSKYFVEHPTIDLSSVSYMINMDMVGRLNDSSRSVTIGGYGTSPFWAPALSDVSRSSSKAATHRSLSVKIDSSGSGPSDHTSFYRKDIPVLFYFTGLHTDYHKPSDDADKINYKGMVDILHHVERMIQTTNGSGKLAFLKTRETQTTTSARFSVSMGIMPDYTYSGAGVRADGISEGKPAQKAGLRTGDIILQLGDHKISSMESYMQTLGKFKKGDRAAVIYLRGTEQKTTEVQF